MVLCFDFNFDRAVVASVATFLLSSMSLYLSAAGQDGRPNVGKRSDICLADWRLQAINRTMLKTPWQRVHGCCP